VGAGRGGRVAGADLMARRSSEIRVPFIADVRDWLRGTDKVVDSTEDIERALDDAGDEAADFERDMTRAMRDTEQQTGRSTRRMGDDIDDITREAGQEARQNLSEGFSSGFRDAEDVADAFTGTLGGLVSGLKGPLGLAASFAAGAAATGFTVMFDKWQQERNRIEESAKELFDEMRENIESVGTAITEEMIRSRSEEWLAENVEKLDEMQAAADLLGIDWQTFVRAMSGSNDDMQELLDKHGTQLRNFDQMDDKVRAVSDSEQKRIDQNQEFIDSSEYILDILETEAEIINEATRNTEALQRARERAFQVPVASYRDRSAYGNTLR
jgi:uncharacterized protein YukE